MPRRQDSIPEGGSRVKKKPKTRKGKGKAPKPRPTSRKRDGKKEEKGARNRSNRKEEARGKVGTLKPGVEAARKTFEDARKKAGALNKQAREMVAGAKAEYRKKLVPYREACRRAGIRSEFSAGRRENVSEKISFLVEKTDKGVRVMVKGRPKTEEVFPLAVLKESINRAAYAYTDKHLGPREKIGNKGGSLSNRLRTMVR